MFTCEIWQNIMAFLLNAFCAFLQYQKDRTFCLQSNQVKYTGRSALTKRRSQVTGHQSQVQVQSTGHHAMVNTQHFKVSPSPNHNPQQSFGLRMNQLLISDSYQ